MLSQVILLAYLFYNWQVLPTYFLHIKLIQVFWKNFVKYACHLAWKNNKNGECSCIHIRRTYRYITHIGSYGASYLSQNGALTSTAILKSLYPNHIIPFFNTQSYYLFEKLRRLPLILTRKFKILRFHPWPFYKFTWIFPASSKPFQESYTDSTESTKFQGLPIIRSITHYIRAFV